jgi:acyl-coenzyme A synthetase/AMP-(fatty) acid ligase/nucleoside-diphosphate-sugar epimerase
VSQQIDLSSTRAVWYQRIRAARRVEGETHPCIHTALETAAKAALHRAILADETGYATYSELLDAIDRRATRLLSCCASGTRVGVLLDSSIEMVVTYFACLKAGLSYVPLQEHPAAVMQPILARLSLAAIVTCTDGRSIAGVPEGTVRVFIEEEAQPGDETRFPRPDPRRAAHILLTSGTESGTPKMVATDHVGSILSHAWRQTLWPYDPATDVVGCNIFGVWDVVPALLGGIPAVMISDQSMRDPFALAATLIGYGVSRIMLTPTLLDACLACDDGIDALRRLRLLVLCGEPAGAGVVHRAREAGIGARIVNLYSLSECHDVAAGEVGAQDEPTCGRVADFAEVFIVDTNDRTRVLPVASPGRVLVGGRALAIEYVDDPDLTAQRFFDLHHADGTERVYDTGDRGILHENGELEIVGRCDEELKVRGAWVDTSAVENVLAAHPHVAQACVISRVASRGPQLIGFVVPTRVALAATLHRELPGFIAARAPAASIPSRFHVIRELPLTPSGKIDRRALEKEALTGAAHPTREGGLEDAILNAVRQVLEDDSVGPQDDFFSVGGDSLAAVSLCGVLHRTTGRRVPVRDVYRHPSPHALAKHVEGMRPVAPTSAGWRAPVLEKTVLPASVPRRGVQTIAVTGATGTLGRAFLAHLMRESVVRDWDLSVIAITRAGDVSDVLDADFDHRGSRVSVINGDLTRERLGLSRVRFAALARKIDVIVHLGASVDAFASFDDLEAVNVAGTHEMLRLASESGATLHHMSSSAVFPLGGSRAWSEEAFDLARMDSLADELEACFPDGYSLSKFAAEYLVWTAHTRGMPVTIWRVPHVLGADHEARLVATARAFVAAKAFPEGDWEWQFVDSQSICRELTAAMFEQSRLPVRHVTLQALHSAQLLAMVRDASSVDVLPIPAFVNAINAAAAAAPSDPLAYASLSTLAQLSFEHGPRAALCMMDAKLKTHHPIESDPSALFRTLLQDVVRGGDKL